MATYASANRYSTGTSLAPPFRLSASTSPTTRPRHLSTTLSPTWPSAAKPTAGPSNPFRLGSPFEARDTGWRGTRIRRAFRARSSSPLPDQRSSAEDSDRDDPRYEAPVSDAGSSGSSSSSAADWPPTDALGPETDPATLRTSLLVVRLLGSAVLACSVNVLSGWKRWAGKVACASLPWCWRGVVPAASATVRLAASLVLWALAGAWEGVQASVLFCAVALLLPWLSPDTQEGEDEPDEWMEWFHASRARRNSFRVLAPALLLGGLYLLRAHVALVFVLGLAYSAVTYPFGAVYSLLKRGYGVLPAVWYLNVVITVILVVLVLLSCVFWRDIEYNFKALVLGQRCMHGPDGTRDPEHVYCPPPCGSCHEEPFRHPRCDIYIDTFRWAPRASPMAYTEYVMDLHRRGVDALLEVHPNVYDLDEEMNAGKEPAPLTPPPTPPHSPGYPPAHMHAQQQMPPQSYADPQSPTQQPGEWDQNPQLLAAQEQWQNTQRQRAAHEQMQQAAAQHGSWYEGSMHQGSRHQGFKYEDSRYEGSRYEGSRYERARYEGSRYEGSEGWTEHPQSTMWYEPGNAFAKRQDRWDEEEAFPEDVPSWVRPREELEDEEWEARCRKLDAEDEQRERNQRRYEREMDLLYNRPVEPTAWDKIRSTARDAGIFLAVGLALWYLFNWGMGHEAPTPSLSPIEKFDAGETLTAREVATLVADYRRKVGLPA